MAQQTYLARIKPFNPKRGYKVKRYTVFGIKFQVQNGWYRVDAAAAAYLKTVHQNNNDPDSPMVFDVCSEAEARRVVEAEKRAKLKRGIPADPLDAAADMTEDARARAAEAASMRSPAEQVGVLDPSDPGALTTNELPQGGQGDPPPPEDPGASDDLPPAPPGAPTDDLPPPPGDSPTPEDLQKIDGVGQATEQKLYEAGFTSYQAVAEADSAALQELVGSKVKDIQKHAKKLAKG